MPIQPLHGLLLGACLLCIPACHEVSGDGRFDGGAACDLAAVGDSGVTGSATFTRKGRGLLITIDLSGLSPGLHAVSVNEYGACGDHGNDAGARFDPTHGDYADPDGRVGDLGDMRANGAGMAHRSFEDDSVALDGAVSVLGRTLVVHARPDGVETPGNTDAGSRLACGVIYRLAP